MPDGFFFFKEIICSIEEKRGAKLELYMDYILESQFPDMEKNTFPKEELRARYYSSNYPKKKA